MDVEKIMMCIFALILGMLVIHMFSNMCGCKSIVEGQTCERTMSNPSNYFNCGADAYNTKPSCNDAPESNCRWKDNFLENYVYHQTGGGERGPPENRLVANYFDQTPVTLGDAQDLNSNFNTLDLLTDGTKYANMSKRNQRFLCQYLTGQCVKHSLQMKKTHSGQTTLDYTGEKNVIPHKFAQSLKDRATQNNPTDPLIIGDESIVASHGYSLPGWDIIINSAKERDSLHSTDYLNIADLVVMDLTNSAIYEKLHRSIHSYVFWAAAPRGSVDRLYAGVDLSYRAINKTNYQTIMTSAKEGNRTHLSILIRGSSGAWDILLNPPSTNFFNILWMGEGACGIDTGQGGTWEYDGGAGQRDNNCICTDQSHIDVDIGNTYCPNPDIANGFNDKWMIYYNSTDNPLVVTKKDITIDTCLCSGETGFQNRSLCGYPVEVRGVFQDQAQTQAQAQDQAPAWSQPSVPTPTPTPSVPTPTPTPTPTPCVEHWALYTQGGPSCCPQPRTLLGGTLAPRTTRNGIRCVFESEGL
jgi:hypothetical protein